jgi:cellulose synthase operon protein B
LILESNAPAAADSGAFDMSTERPSETAPLAAPADATPIVGPAATAPTQTPPSPADASNAIDATPAAQRAILPFEALHLSGEVDSRAWTVDLTRGESESPTTLSIGYKSALAVARESSRLRVLVNDRLVLERSIAASEQLGRLSINLPGGLLRPGAHLFRAEVSQRHRTD